MKVSLIIGDGDLGGSFGASTTTAGRGDGSLLLAALIDASFDESSIGWNDCVVSI